jgi:hypothetical protein
MSYLGYANPFYHLGRMMRGYLAAPPPRRPAAPCRPISISLDTVALPS